jgi:uncharacterized protein YjlB
MAGSEIEAEPLAALGRVPLQYVLRETSEFPSSPLPVLVYRVALERAEADAFERLFAKHGWTNAWRNGLYSVHHYHSTAHEVLGVYRGSVQVRLGGEQGVQLELKAGDAIVIPGGVAHKNEGATPDFAVVGAYPTGTGPDMQYGKPGEGPAADRRVQALSLPIADPLQGPAGPLVVLWKSVHRSGAAQRAQRGR